MRRANVYGYHHMNMWRDWLEENVGEQGNQWFWHKGDEPAQIAIYFEYDEDATAFRLKFKL